MNRNDIYDRVPPVSTLMNYLLATGWNAKGKSDKYTLFQRGPENQPLELVVARSQRIKGWEKSVANTIEILSGYQGITSEEIIAAILSTQYDVFKSRISNSLVKNNTIDMETAVDFVNGLKNLMTSAASAELQQKQLVLRSPSKATEYGRKCRFGHTFKGSFGFVVESPIEHHSTQGPALIREVADDVTVPTLPFERKVVQRIAMGMTHLDYAHRKQDTGSIVQGYSEGFNANMLDDLISLHTAAKFSRLVFSFDWSPELRQFNIPTDYDFKLSRGKIELVEAASREMKKIEKPERELYTGYVTDLHTDIDFRADDIFHDDRKIVVKLVDKNYHKRMVHIPLSESEYKKALHAHEKGLRISIRGTMQKRGRYWYLASPDLLKYL